MMQVGDPDVRVVHVPSGCGRCGQRLEAVLAAGPVTVRQVFDVPELKVMVTEHVLHAVSCGCGHTTRAQGPVEATAPAVYGPNVTALAAYLSAQQHLPVGRVAEVLADVAGIEVSAGWITTACRRLAQAVTAANTAIKAALIDSEVVHFDESVTRIAGRNHWMHTAATSTLTAYHVDEHGRGARSVEAFGILPAFTGIAVHDAYQVYDVYNNCTHALCNQGPGIVALRPVDA